jgi:hypothetical protein
MKFKFSINQPCHENWANMTPNEKGRFCSQCSKTVHDFTNHAPQEIAEALKGGSGHICGRVPNHLLNQEFTQAGYGKWGALALVGATALLQQPEMIDTFNASANKNHIQVNTQNNYYKISGSVQNSHKQPVGGAVIQILQNEKFIAQGFSLSTGNFALYIDKIKTSNEPVTVRIQKEGYVVSEETLVVAVNPDWKHDFILENEITETTLSQEYVEIEYVTMGDMMYESPYIENEVQKTECTNYQVTGGAVAYYETETIAEPVKHIEPETKIKSKPEKIVAVFENINKLSVYPNPATEQIILDLYYDKSYNAMIYDLTGKLIRQQSFTSNKLQMNVNELVPGNYIVYVVDTETQYSMSQKIVVVR